MLTLNSIYKCQICGNIVETVHAGAGALVCCGQPMTQQLENTVDASQEKHVPELKIEASQYVVSIGSVEHPMEEAHYIEWIELVFEKRVYRSYLAAGDKPMATFCVAEDDGKLLESRAYCNLHGLWSKK